MKITSIVVNSGVKNLDAEINNPVPIEKNKANIKPPLGFYSI